MTPKQFESFKKLLEDGRVMTDATFDLPFPASYAYANIGGIIIPDDIPAPILAISRYVVLSAK